ncbi:amidohydrolase family protein [SAR202 cluster bacterium AD-493-K16_JPT_193m]|nr:amidohydrolase family protein [SAR202 cluster bacterium AD-493-K16_JPT_193m]
MMAKSSDLLISGGLVVTGDGVTRADILVSDGKIKELGQDLSNRPAARVIDASGNYVLPGGLDSHAHPIFADKMDTYSICAAYGGVTTVLPFIGSETYRHEIFDNHWGVRDYNPDIVKGFIEYAEEASYTDFAIHGLITTRDTNDIDQVIPDLIRLGVISFKMFMTWNPWGASRGTIHAIPDELVMQVMDLAGRDGGMAMVHAENGVCKAYLEHKFRSEGKVSIENYLPSAPNIIEAEAVHRAATMATLANCALYPVHLSAKEVVPILKQYKNAGLSIYGETCPHYLSLTNQDLLREGYVLKVSPPLREEEDKEAMWKSLASGVMSVIGSDYTGYTRALKLTGTMDQEADEPTLGQENIFDIGAGLTTLEFMMPLVWTHGVNTGRITLTRFVQSFCENPAKLFGIYPQKGTIKTGSDADIVIWDPAKKHTVDEEHGNSDFSTFKGMELLGMPIITMVRGNVVIENGEVVGKSGKSKYIAGNTNTTAYANKQFQVA